MGYHGENVVSMSSSDKTFSREKRKLLTTKGDIVMLRAKSIPLIRNGRELKSP